MPKITKPRISSIPGFPGYLVDEDGDVWSTKSGERRKLKPKPDHRGYLSVGLCRKGKMYPIKIHRLVLEAFDRLRLPGEECRHFPDRDKTNNHLENLSWGSHEENQEDRLEHGQPACVAGEGNMSAKLTNEEVLEIYQLKGRGITQQEVGSRYGISPRQIGKIWDGRYWSKITGAKRKC